MQTHAEKNTQLDMDRWHEIIKAWEKSGENQKAYCERLGVSLNTFSYARSKLLKQNKPKAQFIPLTIKNNSEENALTPSVMVLENTQGYKLHLSASLSVEQLTKIFKISGWNNA